MTENNKGSPPKEGVSLQKASNTDLSVSRLRLGEIGYSGLREIRSYVDETLVKDLRFPHCLQTFDKMCYDHDVRLGLYLSQIFVEKAFAEPNIKFNKNSDISKEAAEFIKWNLNNMVSSFPSVIRDAYSFKKYGFSLLVKSFESITSGKYNGKYPYKIKKLSSRAQKTLNKTEPFLMKDGEVFYARQDTKSLSNTYNLFMLSDKDFDGKSYVDIPRNKFMLFSYDSTNGNPLGTSPLTSCAKAWKEKILIADYETVGVSKDAGGLAVLTAPSSILDKAAVDPSSPEAISLNRLMSDMANVHAGDQSYMILPSDLTDGSTTKAAFEMKLLGIEGGGKQYSTTELIADRQKAILNVFGAAFAILGQGTTGSYSLADTQSGLHAFFVEKDIKFICEVFNRELIPQLLALNDIRLEDEDMPKLVPGIVDEADVDLASKAIQRATAVGQMPIHPELLNEILADLGYEYRIPESVINNEDEWNKYASNYVPKAVSRSGDGMATAGEGTSTDPMEQDDADVGNLDS